MVFKRSELDDFIMVLENEMKESKIKLDEKLGLVFYQSTGAIKESLEKSIAFK